MILKINMTEELLKPLIQEHLVTGRAVHSLICDAIAFRAKCIDQVEAGRTVLVGKINGGYVNDRTVLMEPEVQ